MVYNPTGRTAGQIAVWAAIWAVGAIVMVVLALNVASTSTSAIAWTTAVLSAGLSIASLVAIAKLRNAAR